MRNRFRQLGQGMTEYIIIVALIAIAAIAVYGLFGDTIRGQMGAMTQELAGQDGSSSLKKADDAGKAAAGAASDKKTLSDYTGQSN
ncbi:pilus assembly protein [Thiohalobacter sp.]|uniref:pilus assembly protein n=1 Tax=Thiohalobacter sp. TaxID=2025948 RepID=UPI002635A9F1|nr:pilus assembly protein [Thiohalobacter sp.]